MELKDLPPSEDPKGGSSKTPTPIPIRRARMESEMDERQHEVIQDIKSEWLWRGQTEEQIKHIQKTGDETKEGIKELGTKIEKLQLEVQAQVTKMVMISGILVWIASVVTSVVAGYIFKVITK